MKDCFCCYWLYVWRFLLLLVEEAGKMLLWMKPQGPLQAAREYLPVAQTIMPKWDPAVGSDYASCVVLINA